MASTQTPSPIPPAPLTPSPRRVAVPSPVMNTSPRVAQTKTLSPIPPQIAGDFFRAASDISPHVDVGGDDFFDHFAAHPNAGKRAAGALVSIAKARDKSGDYSLRSPLSEQPDEIKAQLAAAACRLDPTSIDVHFVLGTAAIACERYCEAVAELKTTVELATALRLPDTEKQKYREELTRAEKRRDAAMKYLLSEKLHTLAVLGADLSSIELGKLKSMRDSSIKIIRDVLLREKKYEEIDVVTVRHALDAVEHLEGRLKGLVSRVQSFNKLVSPTMVTGIGPLLHQVLVLGSEQPGETDAICRLGSWNIRFCLGFHELSSTRAIRSKVQVIFDVAESKKMSAFVLQECPVGDTLTAIVSSLRELLSKWDFFSIATSESESTLFAFDKTVWEAVGDPRQIAAKEKFRRQPVALVLRSLVSQSRTIIKLVSIHTVPLKKSDAESSAGSESTDTENEIKLLGPILAMEKANVDISSATFAAVVVLGDFNYAPPAAFTLSELSVAVDTDLGCWKPLVDARFVPILSKGTPTNACNFLPDMGGMPPPKEFDNAWLAPLCGRIYGQGEVVEPTSYIESINAFRLTHAKWSHAVPVDVDEVAPMLLPDSVKGHTVLRAVLERMLSPKRLYKEFKEELYSRFSDHMPLSIVLSVPSTSSPAKVLF